MLSHARISDYGLLRLCFSHAFKHKHKRMPLKTNKQTHQLQLPLFFLFFLYAFKNTHTQTQPWSERVAFVCHLCTIIPFTKIDATSEPTYLYCCYLLRSFSFSQKKRTSLLAYQSPPRSGVNRIGQQLNLSQSVLKLLHLPPKRFKILTRENVKDFVFVTADSKGHFKESIDGIASLQKYFPDRRIIYYDIGLSSDQRKEVGH